MSERFSIVKTINIDKIFEEIDNYIMITGETNPYIFMNEDTSKAIDDEVGVVKWIDPSAKSNYKGIEATFTGYKIFINNDLEFGIVEIR